ncbi:MAG: TIGR04283 family arsenosugar biosynthesis glycosyltransferase, partial [Cyclonatronaceae bacterium]
LSKSPFSPSPSPPFMRISVVIPVYNEAGHILELLNYLAPLLKADGSTECLIVDAQSPDGTAGLIHRSAPDFSVLQSPKKGRAAQMNYGAAQSTGELLYFLHADSFPPKDVFRQLRAAVRAGANSGCYRLRFDDNRPVMRLYAWFTRFDLLPFRYGDQSLFVSREAFRAVGGFREDLVVMEDNEIVRLLRKRGGFQLLQEDVVTSARKYHENGFLRLQIIFSIIFVLYYAGASQDVLVQFYRDMIRGAKQ